MDGEGSGSTEGRSRTRQVTDRETGMRLMERIKKLIPETR